MFNVIYSQIIRIWWFCFNWRQKTKQYKKNKTSLQPVSRPVEQVPLFWGEWVSRLYRHNINESSTFYPASPDKLAYAYPGPDLPRPGNNTIHLLLLIGRRMDWQIVNKCWLKSMLKLIPKYEIIKCFTHISRMNKIDWTLFEPLLITVNIELTYLLKNKVNRSYFLRNNETKDCVTNHVAMVQSQIKWQCSNPIPLIVV